MKLKQQRQLIKLYEQYQVTDHETIKKNLTVQMNRKKVKPSTIAKHTGIAYQTIRQISLKEDANPTAKTTRKLNEYLNKLQK